MPETPAETESEIEGCADSPCSALVEALKATDRHIEELERIGGYGVVTSVCGARKERAAIIEALVKISTQNE